MEEAEDELVAFFVLQRAQRYVLRRLSLQHPPLDRILSLITYARLKGILQSFRFWEGTFERIYGLARTVRQVPNNAEDSGVESESEGGEGESEEEEGGFEEINPEE